MQGFELESEFCELSVKILVCHTYVVSEVILAVAFLRGFACQQKSKHAQRSNVASLNNCGGMG